MAALASVLARRARRTGDGNYPLPGEREKLLAASRAWYSHPWTSGWLTNRLDEAIHKFGLSVPTNADKVPRIAEHVLHSTLIRSKDLDLLDSELRRRSE